MNKQKILMLKGLPGSGKSTWAKDFVAKSNGKAKRVNKDDLRAMIDSGAFSKPNENFILHCRNKIVKEALIAGIETIIIDDTNFEPKHKLAMNTICIELNQTYNILPVVEWKEFLDIPLNECIRRDAIRAKPVGEKVITDMYNRYIAPSIPRNIGLNETGNAIIVDVDGTLAHNNGHRSFFEWSKVGNDEPIIPIINLVNMYSKAGYHIIIVSAREGTSECRYLTQNWFVKHGIPYDSFYMRNEKDFRKDDIIKTEIYNKFIKDKFKVEVVLDDRTSIVNTWRNLGIRCLQVAPGDF